LVAEETTFQVHTCAQTRAAQTITRIIEPTPSIPIENRVEDIADSALASRSAHVFTSATDEIGLHDTLTDFPELTLMIARGPVLSSNMEFGSFYFPTTNLLSQENCELLVWML